MSPHRTFTENRIKIRPYREDDLKKLYEAAKESVEEVYPWLPWCHPAYSKEDSEAWIDHATQSWEDKTEFNFAIFAEDESRLLGGVGLNQIDQPHKVANLGYWVRSSATGQSIATTASLMTARFAFEELEFNRIEIVMSVDNVASQQVAEKIGATKEARLRNRLELHDELHDAFLYALLPEDMI
ncbi:MAG: GNAT family N-acetyltransferase [Candidatus Marinimicrobia bacterium]|nr:GNAT family N-acetyltransferase [Candidatus Neomarinimicrobiota bacterium]MCF7827745.1 GNAT family N-acetyltransferase [Candidatus Neomarinimicrobiota bacterium]MCF7881455.1 GNAT family N-acetyltransferase [Candidatus Neomarinimicrobiota bacterium]